MAKDDDVQTEDDSTAADDDGQSYVDRDKVDFDPDDGLLSGTAIDGTSEIPGPHKEPPQQGEQREDEQGDGEAADG